MGINDLFYEVDSFLSYNSEYGLLVVLFLMFFILMFVSVRRVLFVKNSERGIAAIIAVTVSLIATAYLSKSETLLITSSYRQLGFLIWFFLPFFLLMIFVHSLRMTSGVRRVIVLFCSVLFYYFLPNREIMSNALSFVALGLLVLAIVADKPLNEMIRSFRKKEL